MKTNYIKLIKNIGLFTLANLSTKILSFFILPLYTLYLSTKEYGTLDLVNNIVQLSIPIFTLSIIEAVFRFGLSDKEDKKKYFSSGFAIVLVGSIVFTGLAVVTSFFFSQKNLIVATVIIFVLQSFNSLFAAFCKVLDQTKKMLLITTVISFSLLLLNVVLIVFYKMGINGYLLSIILSELLGFFLYLFFLRLKEYISVKGVLQELASSKAMLEYSIPLMPNSIFWWANSSLDRWFLTFFSNLSVVGLYSIANRIPSILAIVSSIFFQAWNISLFETTEGQEGYYAKVYRVFADAMFVITLLIIISSKFIAGFLFLKNFKEAWIYIPILTMGVYYNAINGFLGSLFTAKKQTKPIFSTTALGTITNIVFNFVLGYFFLGLGVATATLISYLVVNLRRRQLIRKQFNISIAYGGDFLKFILLILATLLVSFQQPYMLTIPFTLVSLMIIGGGYLKSLRLGS